MASCKREEAPEGDRWNKRKARGAHFLLIVLAAVSLYSNTLFYSFHYDDMKVIVDNPYLREGNPLRWFTQIDLEPAGEFRGYRPLVMLTFALNYRMTELNPLSYNATNLLIHIACGWLIYLILMTLMARGENAPHGGADGWIPLLGALLFTVHPINTETVNYIWARSSSLATLFYLSGFYLFMTSLPPDGGSRSSDQGGGGIRLRRWFGAAACYLLSAFCKGLVVSLPIMLLLGHLYISEGESLREKAGKVFRRIGLHIPFLLLMVVHLIFVLNLPIEVLREEQPRSVISNIYTQANAFFYYIRLILVPTGLNVDHSFPEYRYLLQFPTPLSLAGLAALMVYAFTRLGRGGLIPLGILWFMVALAPTSSFVPLKMIINEHRLYLPMAGIVIISAGLLHRLRRAAGMRGVILLSASLLAFYGSLTILRNPVWKDEYSLWMDAASKSPDRLGPHVMLGMAYHDRGMLDEAIAEYRRALEIHPRQPLIYFNLGNTYLKKGDHRSAIEAYRRGLKLEPNNVTLLFNLGVAYGRDLNFQEALEQFRRILEVDPSHREAQRKAEQFQSVRDLYTKALQRIAENPSDPKGHFMLGNVYSNLGLFRDAVRAYQESLRLNPDQFTIHMNLGKIYLNELEEEDLALRHLRRAAALSPDREERGRILDVIEKLLQASGRGRPAE